jgi:hypothetical protein
MILGFTGTRTPITDQQENRMDEYIRANVSVLHHGACINADEESHRSALRHGAKVIVHPPTDGKYMMQPDWNHDLVTVLPHKPYHDRNRDIVHACNRLLALPNSPRRPHSGTWYTIDYALAHGVPVDIIWSDGSLEVGY